MANEEYEYRSTITPRASFNRASGQFGSDINISPASGNRTIRVVTETVTKNIGSGVSSLGSGPASAVRENKERERKQLSELNDLLASYIEKVRFLEAQNRKLGMDIENIKKIANRGPTTIKTMFEVEIRSAQKMIDDTDNEKRHTEEDLRRLQDQVNELRRKFEQASRDRAADRQKIDDLLVELSNLEAEINLLKRRIALLEDEVKRLRAENQRLQNEIRRVQTLIDQARLTKLDNQNKVKTLLEEIEYLRRANEQEIKDLQDQIGRDTTNENRAYFGNELANAIRDIRRQIEDDDNAFKNDMDSWYRKTVQEIETQGARNDMEQGHLKDELKRLKQQLADLRNKIADAEGRNAFLQKQLEDLNNQIEDDQRGYEDALNAKDNELRKLREECQALMVELQMLLDAKQTLDAEIAIYRKMLEGEGDGPGLRQLVEQVVRTTGINEVADTETMRVVKGETSSHQSYSRSAKGNVSIQETSPDGKFVTLENTHRSKEEAIGEWKLKRKIDGKREIVYTFPKDYVLLPGRTVKIWARNQGGIHNPPAQLIFDGEETFGVGANIQTILYNTQGEERATLNQRQSQTSQTHQ
ncbi:unnamed protein product [Bursaphelenchus okinawaensis]|uniref:Intermediate filament gliarin n=1 Tax=Bursaphelenchus okinawaensis TaxID=465554 RepID=A0A811KYA0_9BILA|nr:unnamed protein product [Bursaphelenchus okinawaensis]CAG9115322.1 unnamed protein product [Bursaphelenchus okinawaensis]